MPITSGTLTLNGVTDEQLAAILEIKAANESVLHFEPQTVRPGGLIPQPQFPPPYPPPMPPHFGPNGQILPQPPMPPVPPPPPYRPGGPTYDNVVLTWSGDQGLTVIGQVLQRLGQSPMPGHP